MTALHVGTPRLRSIHHVAVYAAIVILAITIHEALTITKPLAALIAALLVVGAEFVALRARLAVLAHLRDRLIDTAIYVGVVTAMHYLPAIQSTIENR